MSCPNELEQALRRIGEQAPTPWLAVVAVAVFRASFADVAVYRYLRDPAADSAAAFVGAQHHTDDVGLGLVRLRSMVIANEGECHALVVTQLADEQRARVWSAVDEAAAAELRAAFDDRNTMAGLLRPRPAT